jgi:hypothetical protein
MSNDEIIEMARQAGFFINDKLTITSPFIEDICISPMLKEFAKLVAAKEREICAQICENFSDTDSYDGGITTEYHAILIRQRGEA